MSSSLVPPQVLVDTPRPQKEKGEKQSDLSIALNNYVASRPSKSERKRDIELKLQNPPDLREPRTTAV